MTRLVHSLAKKKGWWRDQEDSAGGLHRHLVRKLIPEKLALIHSEISEALEEYRAGRIETYWVIPDYGNVTMTSLEKMDHEEIVTLAGIIVTAHNIDEMPTLFQGPHWAKRENWADVLNALRMFIPATYKPEGFAIEMADAVIRIGDLLEPLGLDLEQAIRQKHMYNQRRSYRHGGKAC